MSGLSVRRVLDAVMRAALSTHTVKSRIFMFQAPSDRWFDDSTKSSRKVEEIFFLKHLFFLIAGETRGPQRYNRDRNELPPAIQQV